MLAPLCRMLKAPWAQGTAFTQSRQGSVQRGMYPWLTARLCLCICSIQTVSTPHTLLLLPPPSKGLLASHRKGDLFVSVVS